MLLNHENKEAAPQKCFFKNWNASYSKSSVIILNIQKMFSHKSYKICHTRFKLHQRVYEYPGFQS